MAGENILSIYYIFSLFFSKSMKQFHEKKKTQNKTGGDKPGNPVYNGCQSVAKYPKGN